MTVNFDGKSIEDELSSSIDYQLQHHRLRFSKLFYNSYVEMLPQIFAYNYSENQKIQIDWLKLEVALRNNYHVAVGETTSGIISILGFVKNNNTVSDVNLFLTSSSSITKNDIHFIIPKNLIPTTLIESTYYQKGNFVVFRNKPYNLVNDFETTKHYTIELAQIVLTRFSLIIQAKIMTVFRGEINDSTIDEAVKKLYSGSPFFKVSNFFDPDEQIIHIDTPNVSQLLTETKREYQNKISELNNMLGIDSLAVEKSSGVSETEATSNQAFTTNKANIYFSSRENACKLLNRDFDLDLECIINNSILSKKDLLFNTQTDTQNKNKEENEK